MIHGNIRPENIMIKLDKDQTKIEQIKFINLGSLTKLSQADQMIIPDRIDHFPPEILNHFLSTHKFRQSSSSSPRTSPNLSTSSSKSFDSFSLGILLL